MLKAVTNLINVSQITGVLPVVNGGTGVTTSTGTGNVVLSAAPTLSGNVTLSTGNLIVASGQGIDFSATSGAGTSELLADYEEGTWTPVIADASTGGNAGTAEFTFARYTKIGRMVYFNVNFVNINTSGMTALNNIFVRGLPFTSANYCNGFSNFASVGRFTYTGTEIDAQVYSGGTYLRIYEIKTATAQTLLTVAAIASGFGYLYINGSYEV